MKILILGAGGVGGYFGARLVQSGADVTFLVRQARAQHLANHGLGIESAFGNAHIQPATVVTGDVGAAYDLVLLACKAYDLDSALAAITPAVGPRTAVLPLLNGIQHLDLLDARFGPERVLGGVAQIAATLTPDRDIHHLNRMHRLIFGDRYGARSECCEQFAKLCAGAAFESRLSNHVALEMWEKFVFLTTLASMTCLMRGTVGAIMGTDDGQSLMQEMLDECRATATAAGYAPRADTMAVFTAMLTERDSAFTASMLRDIERAGPIEGEHIVGDMLARARALQVDTPLLRVAHCHLQTYAASAAVTRA